MKIGIVIPVHNEEENILKLYQELEKHVFVKYPSYQLLFVNDGSSDKTRDEIVKIINRNSKVELIELSRNWGHQIALSAGLDNINGDYIITMDGDLQHPPKMVPLMLEKAIQGQFHIIHMVKKKDEKRGLIKKVLAKLFYKIFNYISEIELEEHSSDFRLYSKKAINVIKQLNEHDRFIRGFSKWIGLKQDKIAYEVVQRYKGKPTYNIKTLIHLASLGFFSFSVFPIRVSTLLGIFISTFNLLFITVVLLRNIIYGIQLPGYLSLIVSILFMFSFLFIFLGVIGEYIYRIFIEVKKRPLYVIQDHIKGKGSYNEK